MYALLFPMKIHKPDSLPVASATMTNGNDTLVVPASLFPFSDGKQTDG